MSRKTVKIKVRVVNQPQSGAAIPAAILVCALCGRQETFLDTPQEHAQIQREWCRGIGGWQHMECPAELPDLACPPEPRELVPDWTPHYVGPETYQRHDWGHYTSTEQKCGVVSGEYPYIMGG